MSDELLSLEKYVVVFYIVHIIITIIVAILSAKYLKKRFISGSDEIIEKDAIRVQAIENESFMFKLWFKVSLHRNNPKTIFLFIFVFNLSLPVVGYLFTLWTVRYLNNVSYQKRVVDTSIINLDEFETSFLKVERIFGEGSMTDLMTNDYAPKSKKLKALSSLANSPTPANLQIIRQTLSSADDEIRMFGYAIINKAEKSLSSKINSCLEIIAKEEESSNNKAVVASAAQELAQLYWEMVYTELSHESLRNSFIESVVKYLDIAKEFYQPRAESIRKKIQRYEQEIKKVKLSDVMSDKEQETSKYLEHKLKEEQIRQRNNDEICVKLYILMGRVRMKQKRYDDAQTEFTIAQQLQVDRLEFILPYLAEIQFITGNYKVVKSLLEHTQGLELNARLFPIVEQWKAS